MENYQLISKPQTGDLVMYLWWNPLRTVMENHANCTSFQKRIGGMETQFGRVLRTDEDGDFCRILSTHAADEEKKYENPHVCNRIHEDFLYPVIDSHEGFLNGVRSIRALHAYIEDNGVEETLYGLHLDRWTIDFNEERQRAELFAALHDPQSGKQYVIPALKIAEYRARFYKLIVDPPKFELNDLVLIDRTITTGGKFGEEPLRIVSVYNESRGRHSYKVAYDHDTPDCDKTVFPLSYEEGVIKKHPSPGRVWKHRCDEITKLYPGRE